MGAEVQEPLHQHVVRHLERQVLGGRPERHRVVGAGHLELPEADQLRHPRFREGILINGLQEEQLRRHMVLHTYEKLRLEVTEIARAKVMTVNPVPMEVDVLRFKGKGKEKSKDHKEKGKGNKEKGAHGKVPGRQGNQILLLR